VQRLDAQIERISLISLPVTSVGAATEEPGHEGTFEALSSTLSSPRFNELGRIVRALSPTSTSGALLSSNEIRHLILQSGLTREVETESTEPRNRYETDIEWLLVSKATIQTYGLILNTLLDQIIPLSDDIWYWDEVLGSYFNSSLLTIQTSPVRIWALTREVYEESRLRLERLRHPRRDLLLSLREPAFETESDETTDTQSSEVESPRPTLSQQWRQFYSIVQESITERSIRDMQKRILSPVALCRSMARRKRARLRKLREMIAAGLGILLDEGLSFGNEEPGNGNQEWKGLVERSVALMDMVMRNVLVIDVGLPDFEDKVFAGVEEDPELSIHADDSNLTDRPRVIATRILELLQTSLPGHVHGMRQMNQENGRPHRLIRYWLPALLLFTSSSTILRILVNRQDDIIGWIRNFGATARDFWFNWVVDPVRKIVGTIRHDANSEIALMSRDSLQADRESLERMVVEFALDRPELATGTTTALSENQIADIRAKVKAGDVTPVLKAYEKDLRSPFLGAVRGDLVRSLLIQVQKTKVDLEVAISGIDALLKSQELVFGFVGLTPGILGEFNHVWGFKHQFSFSRESTRTLVPTSTCNLAPSTQWLFPCQVAMGDCACTVTMVLSTSPHPPPPPLFFFSSPTCPPLVSSGLALEFD
jgi:nuclear-control-of-ATPase protein 2